MKVLVFGGSGRMGFSVAGDLVRQPLVGKVGLVDNRADSLNRAKALLDSDKVLLHPIDIFDRTSICELMRAYDVGVVALPNRRASYQVFEAAIELGMALVDMLEEYHRRPDSHETEGLEPPDGQTLNEYGESLHSMALKAGVLLLDGMGFAPGISNVTIGQGIRRLDRAHSAVARVGGIPSKEASYRHPLRYGVTWSFDHVLREYSVRVSVRRHGQLVEVDAGTEIEKFSFDKMGVNEELECAITPGMPSLLYTRPNLQDFQEKTIRWPGHWEAVNVMKSVGLFSTVPTTYQGQQIVPREFLSAVLQPKMQLAQDESDVCVMWNTVTGMLQDRPAEVNYYLWVDADEEQGVSAMARVTAFPAAIAAGLIASGEIEGAGIIPPEDIFDNGKSLRLIDELAARGVRIQEDVRTSA